MDFNYDPETPHVRRLADRIEPFIGEMEEALEIPLEQAHRPIKMDDNVIITIKRQRVGEVVRLDRETLQNVSLQTELEPQQDIRGNVTRYNMLSGYGRFYDDTLDRTVSFKIDDQVSSVQKQLLTWSLHHAQQAQGSGKILIEARRIITPRGVVKRYLISDIRLA